ncbi:MAG: cell division protein FtsA [Firmicutes bacterium]|jgi:cell division protein FtsA|nr:cell division protein FtsA [Bacillota bacterium]MDH7496422.1 cell division protein FtsA [Bacillota bacterium]
MPGRKVVAGLDIGTTRVSEVIAVVGPDWGVEMVAAGVAPCQGLRRGVVADIEAVAEAIKTANKRACHMAGFDVRSVFVGVPAVHTIRRDTRGVAAVSGGDGTITVEDMRRALEAAKVLAIPPDRAIISVLPREYIVDGVGGIRNPEGMAGVRLEVDAAVIMGQAASLVNLQAGVERAGLAVTGWILEPVAAAYAVLEAEERERGVILVDVGGQITQIAAFYEGAPVLLSWVPAGGMHITNDIAIGMKVPLEQAERVKRELGLSRERHETRARTLTREAGFGQRDAHEQRRPSGRQPQGPQRLPADEDGFLDRIVEARLREILELVEVETRQVRAKGLAPCGVVFTGGGSLVPGILDLAGEILDAPARTGAPFEMKWRGGREPEEVSAVALGIAAQIANDSACGLLGETMRSPIRDLLAGVRGWFSDFIKDFF